MKLSGLTITASLGLSFCTFANSAQEPIDVFDLSIEELLEIEVVSVAKKSQKASESAAAVFVISQDDINRSGATNIPDVLRMVPGIHVARVDSNKWSVSSRGFADRFSNKLLVLIDGRSIYTPTFSGVYWEDHNVMLEDVEQIEVIRGPGGTVWGANAVNGVINIITKSAADTQGGMVAAGGGSEETGFGSFRYGTKLSDATFARFYLKGNQHNELKDTVTNGNAGDDWNSIRAGFRVDSTLDNQDSITLSGDVNRSEFNQALDLPSFTLPYIRRVEDQGERINTNIMGKWRHTISNQSDINLKMYYAYDRIKESYSDQERNTVDIDFQHRFTWNDTHELIWGLEYLYTHDRMGETINVSFNPDRRSTQLFSFFMQDEITLLDNRLWLTIGSKFEHNDYTGIEIQPSARILWSPYGQHKIWAAISRAVRTPSRIEDDLERLIAVFPSSGGSPALGAVLKGDRNYKSEDLLAYELGYRFTPLKNLSFDLTAFYNHYDDLRSISSQGAPFFNGSFVELSNIFSNDFSANLYGFEMASVWLASETLQWRLSYSFLKTDLQADNTIPVSPEQQVSLQMNYAATNNINLNLWLRYVDETTTLSIPTQTNITIPNYLTLDARLAWTPTNNIELSISGQNLLDDRQLEFIDTNFRLPGVENQRSVYGKIKVNF